MWLAALVPPGKMMRLAVPLYALGLVLLIAVALVGVTNKGAQRWLDLGVIRIQPSEIMKLAMPLLLAWYFQQRDGWLRGRDHALAAVLLAVPVLLVARQPDLGTAILVFAAGAYVIFFAGLSWRVIGALMVAGLASLPPISPASVSKRSCL